MRSRDGVDRISRHAEWALLALPVSLLAARNVVANRIVHILTRRGLDTIRGVDTLIWALIWVGVVGLGPFAGILAVICSDFGSFGKLFSEAIEAADKNPAEGVRSAGGHHLHGVRFGLLPQVFPILLSQVLYYFESNTRSATIIESSGPANRASACRTNPGAGMAKGIVSDSAHPHRGIGDRLDFRQTPFRDHRTAGNRVMSRS
jgi:hypothetical protein